MLFSVSVLSQVSVTSEQRNAVVGVLGQVHISDSTDEDLKAKEDVVRIDSVVGCALYRVVDL